jgi:hypothetical protein
VAVLCNDRARVLGAPYWPEKNMIASNGEQNLPVLPAEHRLSIADRLVGLGLFVALVGAQMTWMGFLGWAALRILD